MSLRSVVRAILIFLFPLAFTSTTYLYLYPVFKGCVFPTQDGLLTTAYLQTLRHRGFLGPSSEAEDYLTRIVAPFRLLVLADPQLEGDSSLPDPDDPTFPRLNLRWGELKTQSSDSQTWISREVWEKVVEGVREFITEDIPEALGHVRKRIDLFGNDYYLAHIYRTLYWWTKPSHVTVLGDLIGSQWITDIEFEQRAWRFWNRVFASGKKFDHGRALVDLSFKSGEEIKVPLMNSEVDGKAGRDVRATTFDWANQIINIPGNHDVGYAGDMSWHRVNRFEKFFGSTDFSMRFSLTGRSTGADERVPNLRIINLNNLNLDTPTHDNELQAHHYRRINDIISWSDPVGSNHTFTLLLTHVPLHKPTGVCVDEPYFAFHTEDDDAHPFRFRAGSLKEQNHLSEHVSRSGFLEGIFGMSGKADAEAGGMGRPGLILTGHDHEGCDTWHYVPKNDSSYREEEATDAEEKTTWKSVKWDDRKKDDVRAGVREVTVRSMMGEFGGNAGLLSAWYDFGRQEWKYEISMCQLGVQHIWWGVHVLDLITVGVMVVYWILSMVEEQKVIGGSADQRGGHGKVPATGKMSTDGSSGDHKKS